MTIKGLFKMDEDKEIEISTLRLKISSCSCNQMEPCDECLERLTLLYHLEELNYDGSEEVLGRS